MAQAHINKEFMVKDKKKKNEVVSVRALAPSSQQQHQQIQQHQQQQQSLPSTSAPSGTTVVEFGQVIRKSQYERNNKLDLAIQ
jgi:hypothetical protein